MSTDPCANYKNQEAIDAALRAANERLMRIDKASGIENPIPQYELGTMLCNQCADAGNPDKMKDMFGSGFHRVCYRDKDNHSYLRR